MRGGDAEYCLFGLINMQDNGTGEEGAVALARALELNTSITTLDLQVCGERPGRRRREGIRDRLCCLTLSCNVVQQDSG